MHRLQRHVCGGVEPVEGQVEDAAAADRGKLVPVAEQRQPGTRLVGDGEQRAGGVLVEHPGLVNHQQIPRPQPGQRRGTVVAATGGRVELSGDEPAPGAVGGPPPAVLERQPRRRSGGRADLRARDLGGLQRRSDDHEPVTLAVQEQAGGRQRGGLAGAGRSLHHDQRPVTGQRPDRCPLPLVEPACHPVRHGTLTRWTADPGCGTPAVGKPHGQVGLDGQHRPGR
jgi:hypothetical protein